MTKQEEIDILQSLKGDTYFAQFFGSKDIDQMCQNINNDFAIEGGCGFSQKAEALERINADLKKEFQQKIHDLGMELIKVLDKDLIRMPSTSWLKARSELMLSSSSSVRTIWILQIRS